ncbi:MAG: hypothetical protein E7362_05200 [Clostridiales bacterium]|nr:hypothetical protein [Clostridiales bacterium]
MKISKLTRKSHRYNEDKIIIGDNYAMVLDGATPLCPLGISPSDASWLVSFVKDNLPKRCNDLESELHKIAKMAGEKLRAMLNNNPVHLPSASLAFAQIVDNKVIICTLGDCEAIIKTKNGNITRQVIPTLSKLDGIALNAIIKTKKEQNISIKEATALNKDILIKHRNLMNKENGYAVFVPDSSVQFKFLKATYNKDEIDEIYLYSDGFAQSFETLKIHKSYKTTFKNSINLSKEINKIEKRSYKDKNYNKYPRLKTIDDISIIKIKF